MRLKAVTLTLLLLAFLVLPVLGNAQEATWFVQPDRGWIGITIDFASVRVAGSEQTVVIVQAVDEDSLERTYKTFRNPLYEFIRNI